MAEMNSSDLMNPGNDSIGPAAIDVVGGEKLLESLHKLQDKLDEVDGSLESQLQELEAEHSECVYSELIHLLAHLRFPPAEARHHWDQIGAHRERMQGRLGAAVDLRVALVSYFLEVNRQLTNPKVIEMKLFESTRESAYRDALTGLYNFRVFRDQLAREVARSERSGSPLSLIMIDIDDFKRFNDQQGHESGNEALARLAGLLTGSLRKGDIAARYGGEEFALILPSTPKPDAQTVAERTRSVIAEHWFVNRSRLTVSIGLATYPADAESGAELIRRSDRAMYVSKANGKNQVTRYGRSRRSHGRVDVEVAGCYRQLAETPHLLTTVDLSEAGLAFVTQQKLDVGSFIEVKLDLGRPESEITASGRVIHTEDTEDGRFHTAAHITDTSPADRARLGRFIRKRLKA